MNKFFNEVDERVDNNWKNRELKKSARDFLISSIEPKYSYNFSWQGRPIIQYPQDIVAMQEIIWSVKPDLIIETGIAHGGSLIFSASMLVLLDHYDAIENDDKRDCIYTKRKVIGIDIDIREHNRKNIEAHPLSSRIQMFEGSSVSQEIIEKVYNIAKNYDRILVCLDSNHTHEHVYAELEAYANLTSIGSYCVVFDTVIEDLPDHSFPDRPWKKGSNAKTAVREFLKKNRGFQIDDKIHKKLLITVAPEGYLKRIG